MEDQETPGPVTEEVFFHTLIFILLHLTVLGSPGDRNVQLCHPNASSNYSTNLMSVFCRHGQAKKRGYGERVREIEHGVFTPLVLSTTGSLGNEATVFYKHLADLLSIKQQKHYSVVMCWLKCRLGFAILRSAITCMRGSRSSRHCPTRNPNIPLAASESLLT